MLIEEIVKNYLKDEMDISVTLEFPDMKNQKISNFLVLEKIGSNDTQHLKGALIAIQSYADSLYQASVLNEVVKQKMKSIIELNEISKCTCNSDYNFTDTVSKRYRYQAIFDISYF